MKELLSKPLYLSSRRCLLSARLARLLHRLVSADSKKRVLKPLLRLQTT